LAAAVGAMTSLIVVRLVVPIWAPNRKALSPVIDVTAAIPFAFRATIDWLSD
jgi:hypothetical protein